MSDNANKIDIEESNTVAGGSTVGDIKGFQLPLGAKGTKKKKESKSFRKKDLEEAILSLLEDTEEETVQRRADGKWVVKNPITGAEEGSFDDRDTARQLNRQKGFAGSKNRSNSSTSTTTSNQTTTSKPPSRSVDPLTGKAKSHVKKKKKSIPSHGGFRKHEALKKALKNLLKESGVALVPIEEASMISYIFNENTKESLWEGFLEKLPRESVVADVGLSEVLKLMAIAEARTLAKSVLEIKKILESTGTFSVLRKEADQCPVSGDVRMPFTVSLGENQDPLLFAVKMEGANPTILFPEQSRNILNNMLTKESKLLRAELMHIQETILDKLNEVSEAANKRDEYLNGIQTKLKEYLDNLSLVETVIMKNLVRNKLRGAK